MKLDILIAQYITYRKSLGEKFQTNEARLKNFCKIVGPNREVDQITEDMINLFLYRDQANITSTWFCRHTVVLGFYQYAFVRGYVVAIPLPRILPKRPQAFVPYIYSKKELRQILDTALCYQKNSCLVKPYMIRIILLLLYSTGLRVNEALSLKLSDINLAQNLIKINNTKFYKSRFVPIGEQLKIVLDEYLLWRTRYTPSCTDDSSLFVNENNIPVKIHTIQNAFQQIREIAGIVRPESSTYQPRLHDLRHTFAVHHLVSWYQENKDIEKLLPILSTYMGHSQLAYTTVYLSMTADLLREANSRFEKYAMEKL